MFDGKGLADKERNVTGYYSNYKLALLLYTSKIMRIKLPDYRKIEDLLWSKQEENGGITSLSDSNGNPTGSANCETTSLVLLVYNDDLINKLSGSFSIENVNFKLIAFSFILAIPRINNYSLFKF